MGLIQVMKHLEDIKEVGHGIAVAFVATVYGVGSANIFFLPAANKLRSRMHEATLRKDMILEGVIGIVEGLNPTLIRMKLDAFNDEPGRPKKAPKPKQSACAGAGKAASGAPPVEPVRRTRCDRKHAASHENHERWLVSYADFITLLFAFFVVMFASTQSDKNKAKEVSDSVREALEHGQFSNAISTVLGRGKHEAQQAPIAGRRPEVDHPTAAAGTPDRHPADLAKSLDSP